MLSSVLLHFAYHDFMTLTLKNGRLELPQEVQDALHLKDGDVMQARVENGRVILEPSVAPAGTEFKEGLLVWMGEATADLDQAIDGVREERLRNLGER
jgi:bifunctional DNA-binding transcriptional regulator/antitoxin component of YhaV-PrlF toxin-antitoxin module